MHVNPAMSTNPHTGAHRDDHASSDERTYAVFTHLAGLLSLADLSLLGLIATLIMWLVKKDQSPFLDDHGREAMNFQLSLLLYAGALVLLAIPTIGLSLILFLPLAILRIFGCIKAAIAANRAEFYRYPMCIRFLG